MDVLAIRLGSKPPGSKLFTNNVALCETSIERVEQYIERWRDQFEIQVLRISRTTPTPRRSEGLGDMEKSVRSHNAIRIIMRIAL